MTLLRLTVSSGTGPLEVRVFVRLLSAALVRDLARESVALDHMVVHGPHDAPASVSNNSERRRPTRHVERTPSTSSEDDR